MDAGVDLDRDLVAGRDLVRHAHAPAEERERERSEVATREVGVERVDVDRNFLTHARAEVALRAALAAGLGRAALALLAAGQATRGGSPGQRE